MFGDPYGNRTHAFAVRGRRLSRLTKGPWCTEQGYYITAANKKQGLLKKFSKALFFVQFQKGTADKTAAQSVKTMHGQAHHVKVVAVDAADIGRSVPLNGIGSRLVAGLAALDIAGDLGLLPSIFLSIRVFSNESVLCIRWPKYWSSASASVLPMNIQD